MSDDGVTSLETTTQELPVTSFGSIAAAENSPIVQFMAPYGIVDKAETFNILGGTATSDNSLFLMDSGTDPNGRAVLLSKRQLTYHTGQGLIARLTTVFDAPAADNSQLGGLIGNTDSLVFGYNTAQVFGIFHSHHGESEIQELTITVAAAGAESATVTVNGNPYTVPLTAGTVQHNAFEISESLNSQVAEYDFSSNNDQVVARSLLAAPAGAFAFSSPGAAVAAWASVISGVLPTDDFIPQSEWNLDKRPDLDPAKGNVYQIQLQYLGFGAIVFYVEDSASGMFVPVHRIRYANKNIITSVGNPTFRIGWLTANIGNTTSVVMKGASAAGFIEGINKHTERSRAFENTNPNIVLLRRNVITLRNRLVFGTRRNRTEVSGLLLTLATDANKPVVVGIHRGAIIAGDLDFQYLDKANSVLEFATDDVLTTNGVLIGSFVVSAGASTVINLRDIDLIMLADEVFTVDAAGTSGAGGAVTATLTTLEDL